MSGKEALKWKLVTPKTKNKYLNDPKTWKRFLEWQRQIEKKHTDKINNQKENLYQHKNLNSSYNAINFMLADKMK